MEQKRRSIKGKSREGELKENNKKENKKRTGRIKKGNRGIREWELGSTGRWKQRRGTVESLSKLQYPGSSPDELGRKKKHKYQERGKAKEEEEPEEKQTKRGR